MTYIVGRGRHAREIYPVRRPPPSAGLADPLFGNVVDIDNQPAPVLFDGLIVAAIPYVAKSTGLVEFMFNWTGGASVEDSPLLSALLFQGSSISGGTVIGGISYPIGSLVVVSGGTFEEFVAFQSCGAAALEIGEDFPGGAVSSGLVQLEPGLPYVFEVSAFAGVNNAAYANQSVTVAVREVE